MLLHELSCILWIFQHLTEDINLPVHNISLNSNDTERCIVVYITDDAIPEKNETFIITLSLLGDGAVAINPELATVVVQDNDRKWTGTCNVLSCHYVI